MPEDVFRIVVTAAVVLAAIAFVAQAIGILALFRAVRTLRARTEPLFASAEPALGQLGPAIAKLQDVAEKAGPVIQKIGALVEKATPVVEKAGPVIEKSGPAVDQARRVLQTVQGILDENRPRITNLAAEATATVKTGREQVERVGELLHDAGDRARARLEQIDRTVDSTVGQIEEVGDSVKRAVLKPVREVNGLAAGISAAVGALVRGRKYPVDHATQDEEMFI
ncbi:MAG: hypothetical protein LAQ30_26880 [Acidobacteriia bacterium]|nr:hypothetical protein [Terriglobia bacterium]